MIKGLKISIYTYFLIIIVIGSKSYAQNIFQSNQYMIYQPIINFSAASSYNQVNFTSFYRNQWVGFKGSPTTFGFIGIIPLKNTSVTLGTRVFNEQIGIHNKTEIKLDYAYKLQTQLNHFLSFSISPKINIHQSSYQKIETNTNNDPNFNSNPIAVVYPNAEFGLYHFSPKFYLGISSPNLLYNTPINDFTYTTQFSLPHITYYIHSGYKWSKPSTYNIYGSIYLKTTYGAPVVGSLNAGIETLKNKLLVGLSYRTTNELVPLLRLNLNKLTLGYAFQYSLSSIRPYNNGTHEILLNYNIKQKATAALIAPRF
ncbi:MAG: PorP/SprF family type IX secretion system membrane protein [Flavobacteriales bacterium]|nr:PorP/SprF family type IX secretion system membrane protein [Flavobacteriales bacterium]